MCGEDPANAADLRWITKWCHAINRPLPTLNRNFALVACELGVALSGRGGLRSDYFNQSGLERQAFHIVGIDDIATAFIDYKIRIRRVRVLPCNG